MDELARINSEMPCRAAADRTESGVHELFNKFAISTLTCGTAVK
jgi:hypothetical protein